MDLATLTEGLTDSGYMNIVTEGSRGEILVAALVIIWAITVCLLIAMIAAKIGRLLEVGT